MFHWFVAKGIATDVSKHNLFCEVINVDFLCILHALYQGQFKFKYKVAFVL